jgi:hypothetical protein
MQPCGTGNPLVIGDGIHPSEQCAIESNLNAYFGCRIMEDWFARSAKSWGELLIGMLCPWGVAEAYSNDRARRTAYPEAREDDGNCGG